MKFRTLSNDDSVIRLVQGGDMGWEFDFASISRESMAREPHAILIGGDIAYADREIHHASRWLSWFNHMKDVMTTPEGYLVPMIVAVGTHEVNSYSGAPEERAPFFLRLFPNAPTRSTLNANLAIIPFFILWIAAIWSPTMAPSTIGSRLK